MKIIDVINAIHDGKDVGVFTIKDDRYKYFIKDGTLYQQKYDYEPSVVEWNVYKEWLDEEIHLIETIEKWYLIYQYHDEHIVEFDDKDSLNTYLNTLKDTYKYDSDFKYKIIHGREIGG